MSRNDLILRGEVEDILCNAYDGTIDEGALAYLISELKKIPAVPQEMSAREFGDAFRRYYFEDFLPSNDTYDTEIDTYAHCFEITPELIKKIEKWTQEHPEERSEQ